MIPLKTSIHKSYQSIPDQPITKKFHEFDDIFDVIGSFGRYQLFVAFCAQYSCLAESGNYFIMTFGTIKPTYTCHNETQNYCSFVNNCTDKRGRNELQIKSDFYSLTQHWQLICEKDYVPNLLISIQLLGQALGFSIGGHLADYFGRKWTSFVGLVLCIGCGMLCTIAPNWETFAFFMLCMGLGYGIHDVISALCMEITGKRHRLLMTIAAQWVLVIQVIALVAYLAKDWRWYMITVNAMCLPFLILMLFIDESPRWLIQKKKFQQAAAVLRRIARWNKRNAEIVAENLETIQLDDQKTTYSVLKLFSTKRLALYTCICLTAMFFCGSSLGIILFNMGALAGSPFLNVALYGLLRMWAAPLLTYLEIKGTHSGRRPMFLGSLVFVIACLLGIIIIQSSTTNAGAWYVMATALALAAISVISGVLEVATLQYGSELFPTVLRGIALGTFHMFEQGSELVSPQLLYLQKYWPLLPYVAVSVIGIVAFIPAIFILPETAGKALPDALIDAKRMS